VVAFDWVQLPCESIFSGLPNVSRASRQCGGTRHLNRVLLFSQLIFVCVFRVSFYLVVPNFSTL